MHIHNMFMSCFSCTHSDGSRATFLDNGGCEQLTAVLKSYSKLSVTPDNEKLNGMYLHCVVMLYANTFSKLMKLMHYTVQLN